MKKSSVLTAILLIMAAGAVSPAGGNPFRDNEELQATVDMSFSDADIKDVLKAFSRDYGISIVIEEAIEGKVTANFADVTVGEALESVLAMAGCGWERRGDIIMVSQEKPVKRVFSVGYKLNENLTLQIQSLLSDAGQLVVDPSSSSIMVIDRAPNIEMIDAFLNLSDLRKKQVMIEAKIVEVNLGKDDELGGNWEFLNLSVFGMKGVSSDVMQNLAPEYATDNYGRGTSGTGDDELPYRGFQFQVSNTDADFLLQALARDTKLDLLSAPRVATMNNEPAVMRVIEKVPYVSSLTELTQYGHVNSKTEIEFEEVGITLEATPQIAPDGAIFLKIRPEISEVVEWFNGTPVVDKRSVETTIKVMDGGTVIIGGLLKDTTLQSVTKTPILGDIPGLGVLFRGKRESKTKAELLIFISPVIIDDEQIAREIEAREESLDSMRRQIKSGLFH